MNRPSMTYLLVSALVTTQLTSLQHTSSSFYSSSSLSSIAFHLLYIPGWNLTSSMNLLHFSLDCTLILQILHPTSAMSSSNLSDHLNFGLPLLLSTFPCRLIQRAFFKGSFSSIPITCPAHLSIQA